MHFRRWLGQSWPGLTVLGLLVIAFILRVYGLDWDRGLFFHPDERQMLMVVEGLALPRDCRELLSPRSPLNPRFFAYGSFPLYLLRLFSWLLSLWRPAWASMSHFYLLGRLLSAFFDTFAVYATYRLARQFYDRRVALLAAAFVTLTVLHIQLAHFYTVDTMLTAIVLLAVSRAVDVARGGRPGDGACLGVLFGVGLATKVSVLPLAAVIVAAWIASAWPERPSSVPLLSQLKVAWPLVKRRVLLTFGLALACFALFQPYALIDGYHFVVGVGQEIAMSQGWFDFPYSRQYVGTWPYLYQVRQILWFAMGFPLGLLGLGGLLWLCVRVSRRPSPDGMVLLVWPLLYILMQGAAHAKFIRYTLPLLPLLCLSGAAMWVTAWDTISARPKTLATQRIAQSALLVLLCMALLAAAFYVGAFLNIYRQPHPWIQASVWLCQHVAAGSRLLTEEWDDPLPVVGATTGLKCPPDNTTLRLDMYGPDTEAKLEKLLDALETADYIVLSSQRLYASISRLPERYPISSRYYHQLFAGRLGFQLVAAPAVYPQLAGITLLDNPRSGLQLPTPLLLAANRPPGLVLDLGQADESFTVYDHPQPLIFARVSRLPRYELEALLGR